MSGGGRVVSLLSGTSISLSGGRITGEVYPPVASKILVLDLLAADAFVTHTEILTFYF